MKFHFSLLIVFLSIVTSANSYAGRTNRCTKLFDIHLGYNALANIGDFAFGYSPNLKKARILYNNFPKGNESMRQTGLFLIELAAKGSPSTTSIFTETSEANGLLLSYLSLHSKMQGDIKHREYNKKLHEIVEYLPVYYQTFIWEYPMYCNASSIEYDFGITITDFIKNYDAYLLTAKPQTESEKMLYSLFKLQIEFNQNQNEAALLSGLESLILSHPDCFSLLNYQQYVKEYFPKHSIPAQLAVAKKDSFDSLDDHPIYKTIKSGYNTLQEAVNELENNPYDSYLSGYGNVNTNLKTETFSSITKLLSQLDLLQQNPHNACKIGSISFDFTKNILESENNKFTNVQNNELKIRLFQKWLDFHIDCNITLVFYIDQVMIDDWNNFSKEDQIKLNDYFVKELNGSDNHSYLVHMQKALPLKS